MHLQQYNKNHCVYFARMGRHIEKKPAECDHAFAVCFWQPVPSGLNLVVAAVLRDSLCRVIAALRGRLVCCISCVRLSGLS